MLGNIGRSLAIKAGGHAPNQYAAKSSAKADTFTEVGPISPLLSKAGVSSERTAFMIPDVPRDAMRFSGHQQIDVLLAAAIRERQIAGAVLSVSRGDKLKLDRAFGDANGFADGDPLINPEKMTLKHVFDLASITKAFAATPAAMILFEDGLLNLNAPVHTYLTSLLDHPSQVGVIRIHELLSHTAGLPAWAPLQCLNVGRGEVPAAVARMSSPLGPKKHRRYSDLGYMLLGCVIEAIAKEPLDRFLERRFYGPLGLLNTGFNPKRLGLGPFVATSQGNAFERAMVTELAMDGRYAQAHNFGGWRTQLLCGEVNDSNTFHTFGGVSAHAGLFSNASDLQRLARYLVNPSSGPKLFSQTTLDAFMEPQSGAFGWGARTGKASLEPLEKVMGRLPPRTLFAQGFTGTFALLEPTTDTVVILLTNRLQMERAPSGNYANLEVLFAKVVEAARNL